MNTKQLHYAVELSKSLNFSQTAEALGISQPALSKQILHLEQELGLKLFDRTTMPIQLTAAGAHFLRQAQEMLYREDQLLRSMEQYKTGERGRLVIGISPFRSLYLMPRIVKKVRQQYPGVEVILHEAGSDQLRREAAEGKFDFAVINLPVDESVLDIVPIEPDKLVLAVPTELVDKLPDPTAKTVDIKDCGDLPFVAVGHGQELRLLFDKLCAAADFNPNIAMEVVGVNTAWAMARAGIGATLLPLQFVDNATLDDAVSLYSLQGDAQTRQPAIVTRRGQYLSDYAAYAMQLLAEQK
ncbi:MAG: LysR family transcriptional regulator [Clostridia bacterium]|nr:LysR family transcriptional regulator [Clostridia bacterium]